MVFVLDRGEVLVERLDSRSFEEVVGGECRVPLEVLVIDRSCVLGVDGFVYVLASDSRNLGEKRVSQALRDPRWDAFLQHDDGPPELYACQ